MKKIIRTTSTYQALALVKNYKKQGFTFVRNFGKGQNLSFHGTLRTSKGSLRQIYILTNAPMTGFRIASHKAIRNYKGLAKAKAYINGHSWGY